MKLTIFFKNDKDNNIMPISYRISTLHLVKDIFARSGMYKKYFTDKIVKPYTYSVYFNNMRITEDFIYFDKYFILNFSSNSKVLVNHIWENINTGLKFTIGNKEYTIDLIKKSNPKIRWNKMIADISILTNPFVDSKDNKYFITPSDNLKLFNEVLNYQLKRKFKYLYKNTRVGSIYLTPISMEDVIVKHYGILRGFRGSFKINGDKTLIKFIFDNGLGVKTGQGFGYIFK